MNLKKLEAYGFKSFADKLTLEFNTGVTCIVGPNGCGKSNVSDAIRWVLGEQSPKNLRGKSMQEVIFNGTANRKALGYCEVSLYFDNTDRTYALDADEVIIKRKLFRSGDSEYYINNQTARLRDILDLFRDTGIGKDGYSVIGQGKIDGFLSAKPEDRRQIFEEAAGISKYKAKRIESQRKLDRTNDNLLRIKDKLDVYETRMAPLEKQSQEALRARELRERLKIAEVNHFIYLTEHNEEERSAVSQRLEKVTKSLTEAEREQAVLAEEYAYVQEKVHTSDDEYKRLTDEKLNLSIALSKKDGQNKLKAQELENTRKNLERLKAEVSEKNAAVSNHTASREANQKEQQQTILKIVENKKAEEDITEKLKEAETDVEKQRKEIDVTNEMLLSSADMWGQINGGLSKIKTEIALMEKNVEDYENSVDDKSRELKDVRKRLADTLAEYDRLTADRAEKKDIKLDIDKQYGQKFAANEDSVDRYNELRDTVAKLTSKVEYLEASKNSYGSYDAAVRFLMSRREDFIKDKILGVVGSAISTPAKFATAIEVALGGNINNMITADQKDTSFLIDFLNSNRGGRGTFMPLTAMRPRPLEDEYLEALEEDGCFGVAADLVKYDRRFRPAIETLLGRVVVVDTKDTAIEMSRRFRNAFRIVTLDGAHYAVNGTVSGGRKEGADSRIMSVEADLADAKRNLANNKQIMEVLAQDISEAKKELQKMEDTSSVLENIISKLDKELTVCEQKKEYMQREEERLNGEVERLKKLISDAKSEIAVNENLYSIESKKMDNTSGERVNTNDLLDKLAVSLRQKEEKRNAISTERIEIIASGKQLEEKLTSIERSIDISAETITRLNREILDAGVQINILTTDEARIVAELERLASEMADNEELAAIQKEIEKIEAFKTELSIKQETLRRNEQKNSEVISSLSATKAKAEAALERIESDIKLAGERVQEDYGMDYEAALELKDYEFDDAKGVQLAKQLRKDLNSMGEINEKAIEDLASMSAEYGELKIHFDDITEAKESLEETIRDLTVKMETNFSESFEKIKINFAEVFTELFDGGRGMLDLDIERGQSVLDAGIIIAAEPPGKRLQNIDLLSGGERAMTAIALIFAIIKLHPMPFCVLDEVDAPLDDNNADTYAKYLKKFSQKTQFIIVSHRKPTMELADELYGITMQEKGVSKFFSVKLSDALKMAKE
ncbi:MAG: chromosome segregation protein SMC [Clostridiales bacterium]|nr:chromosome segregation protein SMC [Clostridiales bacterium]MDY4654788.1 chromosome segregation protein SMC [Eubacteriales bacterium]